MLTAITRGVSPAIERCELTHLARQPIDLAVAQAQHARYEQALRKLGVQVTRLPAEPDLPDSVFVEDAALVLDEIAVLTRPGAVSRRAEVPAIAEALKPYRQLESIQAPGRLDGGDILVLGRQVLVGLSSRSNASAIAQMQNILEPFGYRVRGVPLTGCLHLKSAVTQAGAECVLINPLWVDPAGFAGWRQIEVHPDEAYAANAVLIRQRLLYQPSFPRTAERLETAGLHLELVDASELGKAEGALTCCSLIFEAG